MKQYDISSSEMNYAFSRLDTQNIITEILYDGALHLKMYTISDSEITPENFSEGTEEFLESIYVSISPDGDAYTESKLIKLEGLLFPEILEVTELEYPKFSVEIEVGNKDKRFQKNIVIN